MPLYRYKCLDCGHEVDYWHPMFWEGTQRCALCRTPMQKKPIGMPAVNWNGPKPSEGGKHPAVENLNATYAERKDAYAKRKEDHVKRTESENSIPPEI